MSKWSQYFMNIAKETALLSKDTKTKVGAVLVKNKKIKSIGYNGAPKSFPDPLVPPDNHGERLVHKKSTFICHAELNALLNYDGKISDLDGADIYITLSPCTNCAKMLAQIGIKNVYFLEEYHKEEETEATEYIFNTCNINYNKFIEE